MTMQEMLDRPFTPGTTGWSVADLGDPEIGQLWEQGRFEIIEGVLTTVPPAYFDGTSARQRLLFQIMTHLHQQRDKGLVATDAHVVLSSSRVVRVDAVYMTADECRRQKEVNAKEGNVELPYGRLLIPPTLVIESLSIGHESHDEKTKRRWYAEFGIPNYWLFNPYRRTLRCLTLRGEEYVTDCEGKDDAELRPRLLPGLTLKLGDVWVS